MAFAEGGLADQVSKAVVGAIIDKPELRDDEEVQSALVYLKGEAMAAVKTTAPAEIGSVDLSPDYLLWVMDRIEKPVHVHLDRARTECLANMEKLRRRALSREKASAEQASAAAEARGDNDESFSLLREAQEAARKKQEARRRP